MTTLQLIGQGIGMASGESIRAIESAAKTVYLSEFGIECEQGKECPRPIIGQRLKSALTVRKADKVPRPQDPRDLMLAPQTEFFPARWIPCTYINPLPPVPPRSEFSKLEGKGKKLRVIRRYIPDSSPIPPTPPVPNFQDPDPVATYRRECEHIRQYRHIQTDHLSNFHSRTGRPKYGIACDLQTRQIVFVGRGKKREEKPCRVYWLAEIRLPEVDSPIFRSIVGEDPTEGLNALRKQWGKDPRTKRFRKVSVSLADSMPLYVPRDFNPKGSEIMPKEWAEDGIFRSLGRRALNLLASIGCQFTGHRYNRASADSENPQSVQTVGSIREFWSEFASLCNFVYATMPKFRGNPYGMAYAMVVNHFSRRRGKTVRDRHGKKRFIPLIKMMAEGRLTSEPLSNSTEFDMPGKAKHARRGGKGYSHAANPHKPSDRIRDFAENLPDVLDIVCKDPQSNQLADLWLAGKTQAEIAEIMSVDQSTISRHMNSLLREIANAPIRSGKYTESFKRQLQTNRDREGSLWRKVTLAPGSNFIPATAVELSCRMR
jgi:hypothetical protein